MIKKARGLYEAPVFIKVAGLAVLLDGIRVIGLCVFGYLYLPIQG